MVFAILKETFKQLNFQETIRNLKKDWPTKTPKEKWKVLCDIPRILLGFFGIRILEEDCQVYWLSYFGSFLALNYFSLAGYTLIYFARAGKFWIGTRCVCGIGIVASSVTLYIKCLTSDRFRLRVLFRFSGDYIYSDVKDSSPFNELCERSIKKMQTSYIILVIVIFISIGSVCVGPIQAFLVKGVMITPFGTKLPFFEEDSNLAFYVDISYQSVLMPFGIVSTICIELCQCMTYNTVELCASCIELNGEKLSEMLQVDRQSIRSGALFRNILLQIRDFDEYLLEFSDVFYWKTFLGPPLLTFGATYGIFAQWILEFPAGYGNAVVSYIALLVICYMGENIKTANEKICDSLCNLAWYHLPKSQQKDIAHMLNRMQNGVNLTQGPFKCLDYDMASTIQ
ncbi:uncharacterized protein LOC116346703 [Contarinia nasturtii]|uniref:uncharacterized protein LOC116346703 n=1 Tax=Contarinia nasturtii TaxID=265458 RepID=UPI0012D3BCF6|nr:uncharacterized protein LOC116346703 [Contarinia nasturtii]